MTSFIKYILVLQVLLLTNVSFAEVDTTLTFDENDAIEENDVPLFDRKNKHKKIKKNRKSNSPSAASVIRLKSQSKRARKTISRTNRNHFSHKKSVRKQQRRQKHFSANKNHHRIKKLKFNKKTLGKQRKRVRHLEDVKTKL